MKIYEIDIDKKKVFVDSQWLSIDELSRRIQQKLGGGDYRISSLSEALERLNSVLQSARELRILVTKDVADSFAIIASRRGEPVEKVIRDVMMAYLTTKEATDILFGESIPETDDVVELKPRATGPMPDAMGVPGGGGKSGVSPDQGGYYELKKKGGMPEGGPG